MLAQLQGNYTCIFSIYFITLDFCKGANFPFNQLSRFLYTKANMDEKKSENYKGLFLSVNDENKHISYNLVTCRFICMRHHLKDRSLENGDF